jgi:hypothetical protein
MGSGRIFDRAEAGDMFVPHPAVNPASFRQTELKPVLSLPEADEHPCSGTIKRISQTATICATNKAA